MALYATAGDYDGDADEYLVLVDGRPMVFPVAVLSSFLRFQYAVVDKGGDAVPAGDQGNITALLLTQGIVMGN